MGLVKRKAWITLLFLPLLVSCGTDMREWPYIELSFNSAEVENIHIDYLDKKNTDQTRRYYSEEKEGIDSIYNLLEVTHVDPKEKSSTKDLQEYVQKVSIYFSLNNNDMYDFKAYICGQDTYFVYSDEIRLFPADFKSVFLKTINDNAEYFTVIK